jgi:glycosyltransferase involved in cell wall biosynthesis
MIKLSRAQKTAEYMVFSNHNPTKLDQKISYVVPVYNAEVSISQVLTAIYDCSILPLNITIVLDACVDNSLLIVKQWIKHYIDLNERKIWIKVIVTKKSIQETRCDNLGFKEFPDSEVIVDVQSDIIIREKLFDLKVLKIFAENLDIFALSNRGTTPWPKNYSGGISYRTLYEIIGGIIDRRYKNKVIDLDLFIETKSNKFVLDKDIFFSKKDFGRLGEYVEIEPEYEASKRSLWLGETVMRGPLAFRNSALKELGYLNEKSHPLAGDDHELTLRAWRKLRLRAAYCPMSYSSPISIGADRRPKPLREEFRNIRWRFLQWIYSNQSALYTLLDPTKEVLPPYEHRVVNFQND